MDLCKFTLTKEVLYVKVGWLVNGIGGRRCYVDTCQW